nr:MAG TPA: hypothetical protein [Caudoviricetes sp.]
MQNESNNGHALHRMWGYFSHHDKRAHNGCVQSTL